MKWHSVFESAIQKKTVLELLYSDGIWRVIEPHTYGVNKGGNHAVSAFRTEKKLHPNEQPDWRMYLDAEIRELRVTELTFNGPRTGYSANPKTFSRVICKL